MPEAVTYSDQLMEWIYDKTGGRSTDVVPILDFAESVGLDIDGAYTLLWFCRDAGLVSDKNSGLGNPCANLTSAGIAHVRGRRARRDDPGLRAKACRTAMLRWFYGRHIAGAHYPTTEHFASDRAVSFEGSQFTTVEIQIAAEYLSDKGLIKGVEVAQIRGPVRAEITTDGIDCVTDWDGDVVAYLKDQRGYGPTTHNHGPAFYGSSDNGQFAWGNRDVVQHRIDASQQIAPGFEAIAEAVAELLAQLPSLGIALGDRQDVEEVANEMLAEVRQSQPHPGRLRKMAAALKGFVLPAIAVGASEALTQEAREGMAQAIDQIQALVSTVM